MISLTHISRTPWKSGNLQFCFYLGFLGHPGLDIDVGEFLDSLQLNNLKDIFEKEQVSNFVHILFIRFCLTYVCLHVKIILQSGYVAFHWAFLEYE